MLTMFPTPGSASFFSIFFHDGKIVNGPPSAGVRSPPFTFRLHTRASMVPKSFLGGVMMESVRRKPAPGAEWAIEAAGLVKAFGARSEERRVGQESGASRMTYE